MHRRRSQKILTIPSTQTTKSVTLIAAHVERWQKTDWPTRLLNKVFLSNSSPRDVRAAFGLAVLEEWDRTYPNRPSHSFLDDDNFVDLATDAGECSFGEYAQEAIN